MEKNFLRVLYLFVFYIFADSRTFILNNGSDL